MTEVGRRAVLKATCAGCAALGLAACGGGSHPRSGGSTPASTEPASTALAKLADIPVGASAAARAPSGQKLLLARPTATTVVGFSATCTHQGCIVEPDGAKLSCPCHGSTYDAFTGRVLNGPALAPLHPFAVKVSGGDVVPA